MQIKRVLAQGAIMLLGMVTVLAMSCQSADEVAFEEGEAHLDFVGGGRER